MVKKQKKKLGNIYAIPLPDGSYAFGRLYKERLAIAKERGLNINEIPDFKNIDFFVGVYDDVLQDGEWPVVGNIAFRIDEEIWTPPTYIEDKLHPGNFEIYYKGEIQKANKKECIGLEITSIWERQHVIDRLMGNNRWTKICC